MNYPKSQLEPYLVIDYLGFVINLVKRELQIPNEKVSIKSGSHKTNKEQNLVSARELATLIGRLTATILAVYPALLHYRSLQVLKHQALAVAGYKGKVKVFPEAREDLLWCPTT